LFLVYEGLGQHTLLGIVERYAKFRATHFTGHLHVGRLHQRVQNNIFRISETAEANIP
jgi:hypothetical protein